jgi:RNA polymerase sigma-70 factor, ECF subfamily
MNRNETDCLLEVDSNRRASPLSRASFSAMAGQARLMSELEPLRSEKIYETFAMVSPPKSSNPRKSRPATPLLLIMRQNKLLFEELLLPHLDGAYNLARWLVETDQEAQAVVRDAYIQAWAGFEDFRGTDARVWLLTIVRNTAAGSIRTRRNQSSTISFQMTADVVPSDQPSLDPSQEQRKRGLHQALSKLPFEFREILVLRDIEGWSYGQLTAGLNLAAPAVISRLTEARSRLRQAMAEIQRRAYQK